MLTLKEMNDTRTRFLYEYQMKRDFPPSELKSLSAILKMKAEGKYDVLGAYLDGILVAYALCYHPQGERVLLLDYLAVEPDMRRRGIGTSLLDELRKYYAAHVDTILIECERPKTAPNESEARQRIRFYTQAGAELTNVRIWLFEVEYSILTLQCRDDAMARDWAKQMLSLYKQMLMPELYERNVRLIRSQFMNKGRE